jgi:3-oxo-5alpha-steroid 4-dehydrogenase
MRARPADIAWSAETDVLVIGLGGAGVCAALEALANGATVTAVERFSGGGATALSGGVVYAGGGTRHQVLAGHHDSPEEMYKYLELETQGVVSGETLMRYCRESVASLAWLEGHGVRIGGPLFDGKTAYPPDGFYLYWSGNERSAFASQRAIPAPRGHRTVGNGNTGHALFGPLRRSAERLGLNVIDHARVTRLMLDPGGAIIGAEFAQLERGSRAYRLHERYIKRVNRGIFLFPRVARRIESKIRKIEETCAKPRWIRARRAVVLAAGGFAYNREMVAFHAPKYGELNPFGTLGCDGSGIRLGQSAGGAVSRLDSVLATRVLSGEPLLSGVLVDRHGNRICNEDAYAGTLGRLIAESPGGKAWLIIDGTRYRRALRAQLPSKLSARAVMHQFPMLMKLLTAKNGRSLESLSRECGLRYETLVSTIEQYNAACRSGVDPLGKQSKFLQPIACGRFYAVDVSLNARFARAHIITMGGLVVDEETGNVRRGDGSSIERLYAAGRTSVGISSNYYVSGTSIGDCIFSGRRAGLHAAREIAGREIDVPIQSAQSA